jgi:hypothetical protein
VGSHAKARRIGIEPSAFGPGIYVRAAGTDAVYTDPVGPIALMANHGDAILAKSEPEAAAWPLLFNDWALTVDSDEALNNRAATNAARAAQTPAPRKSCPAIDTVDLAFSTPAAITLDNGLEKYEKVWQSSADEDNLPLPSEFSIGELLVDTINAVKNLNTAVTNVAVDVAHKRAWTDTNAQESLQRVTDLTLWSSLSGIASAMENVSVTAVSAMASANKLDDEFQHMFSAVTDFKSSMSAKLSSVSGRVDMVESQSLASMSTSEIERLVSTVESMSQKVERLEGDRVKDRLQIEALQTRLESGTARFELSPGVVIRSPRDVRVYLERIGATSVGFGGFADVYNLLARANMMIEASPTFAEAVKSQKDVSGTNMSQDEALVHYSFMSNVPGIFSGKKSDKTSIPSLASASKWKSENVINSGMGYDLEEHVETARNEVEEVISLLYEDFERLQSLCNNIVSKASDFILQFIRWVDETNTTLTSAGNSPGDVWALITKVMRAVFEECLAPHRITPTSSKFKDPLEQTSVMIWGVIRTHIATKAMVKRGFKDHPVVVGAYAQWLVSNSGKKDASEAKASIAKLNSTVSDLRDSIATKKALSALESRIEAVKKVADKAVAAAKTA